MSNYTDTLQRGDKIGCYRIEEALGRGGFAVTYLATDENLDVEVAIKEYLPREITQRDANLQVSARKQEFAEDYEVGLDNFAREAKTLARFKHPHIVRVHQVLHANNTAYMVMDFERGQELAEIMEQRQVLPEDELRGILFPILDGVEEIHRHGFVHRDIKPSNIYIRHNGSPVLIDFGAARYTMSETTQQLTAVVTVGYTPIEQYNVSEDAQGPWSDIYALAAVCYEAVTGEVPTDSVTRASASVTNGDDPLPSVRNLAKGKYTDDCLDAIDWGLRMEAEDRPQVIAQWRDSFDGIFNPASAYLVQKDVSIYSPHRVDKPLQSRNTVDDGSARPAAITGNAARDHKGRHSEVVSIPLRGTDTPLDTGVVSLDPDAAHEPAAKPPPVTQVVKSPTMEMPPVPGGTPTSGARISSTRPDAQSANDASRNLLRRDTQPPRQEQKEATAEPPRKRSKLERPSHLYKDAPPKQRTLGSVRDEIEFDDTDWNYEPPTRSSSWKLLLPALGLAAVVGGSIMYVNFPELVTNLGRKGPQLTTEQALTLAEQKLSTNDFILPAGESALDYFQIILKDDPNNAEARAGIETIEAGVRQQIADNMKMNNLSEANRLLARADKAGLTGLYNTPQENQNQQPVVTPSTVPETTPVTAPSEDPVVTPVDTTPIEPVATPKPPPTAEPAPVNPTRAPSTGIDNNISPYIEGKIAEINALIDDKKFTEARALYNETDKFIPDSNVSGTLLRKIEFGESEAAAQVANPSPTTAPIEPVASVQNNQTPADTAPLQTSEPPRNSYTEGTGPGADHLDQLRRALEAKDIEAVKSLSETLPEGRIRFLNSTFARHHRLDVVIEDVAVNGDKVTGRLNVAMFGKSDDGSVYGAGKWNGAVVTATRNDGVWQKIRW